MTKQEAEQWLKDNLPDVEGIVAQRLTEAFLAGASSVEAGGVEIEIDGNWFPAECMNCGWVGSSGNCEGGHAISDTGDYSDPLCPSCFSTSIEETDKHQTATQLFARLEKSTQKTRYYVELYERSQEEKYSMMLGGKSESPSSSEAVGDDAIAFAEWIDNRATRNDETGLWIHCLFEPNDPITSQQLYKLFKQRK